MNKIIIVDFHNTLSKSSNGILAKMIMNTILGRKIQGLLSGIPFIVNIINHHLETNEELVNILNNKKKEGYKIVVVSAAHESCVTSMRRALEKTHLEYNELVLRKKFFQRHSIFKVEECLKYQPEIVVEDCVYYARNIKDAISSCEVHSPVYGEILVV